MENDDAIECRVLAKARIWRIICDFYVKLATERPYHTLKYLDKLYFFSDFSLQGLFHLTHCISIHSCRI